MTGVDPGGLWLELAPDAALLPGVVATVQSPRGRVRFGLAAPGLLKALDQLAGGGGTHQALLSLVESDAGASVPSWLFGLRACARHGMLTSSARSEGKVLLRSLSSSPPDVPALPADRVVCLSRFALLRRQDHHLLLESPLASSRVTVSTALGAALVMGLAEPITVPQLAQRAGMPFADAELATRLLWHAGLVVTAASEADVGDVDDPRLVQWDFHDLLFLTRSRFGRHPSPIGATYSYLDRPPLPAVRPHHPGGVVDLAVPQAGDGYEQRTLDAVLDHRQSVRRFGSPAITLEQLGALLYRTCRVIEVVSPQPENGLPYEASRRPYPSGGAMYDLEVYLTVHDCVGLAAGLYHYQADDHRLRRLSGVNERTVGLLTDATQAAILDGPPQVLVTFASRFARVSWKYSGIALATTLKNVGALMQTFYLVATAMELAPCALGGGDSDRFAAAVGTDYYAETSVGEFIVGTLPNPADSMSS